MLRFWTAVPCSLHQLQLFDLRCLCPFLKLKFLQHCWNVLAIQKLKIHHGSGVRFLKLPLTNCWHCAQCPNDSFGKRTPGLCISCTCLAGWIFSSRGSCWHCWGFASDNMSPSPLQMAPCAPHPGTGLRSQGDRRCHTNWTGLHPPAQKPLLPVVVEKVSLYCLISCLISCLCRDALNAGRHNEVSLSWYSTRLTQGFFASRTLLKGRSLAFNVASCFFD